MKFKDLDLGDLFSCTDYKKKTIFRKIDEDTARCVSPGGGRNDAPFSEGELFRPGPDQNVRKVDVVLAD